MIEWKTSAARYPEQPDALLALGPQLAAYSWATGEPEVAFFVFVRKRLSEIQYLRATINDDQRNRFHHLLENTLHQIESAQFPARSGIRFPQKDVSAASTWGSAWGNKNWSSPP